MIDREIDLDRSMEKSTFIDRAVSEFARRLERRMLEDPADFAWHSQLVQMWMRERPAHRVQP